MQERYTYKVDIILLKKGFGSGTHTVQKVYIHLVPPHRRSYHMSILPNNPGLYSFKAQLWMRPLTLPSKNYYSAIQDPDTLSVSDERDILLCIILS
jgi:hypothetical protein